MLGAQLKLFQGDLSRGRKVRVSCVCGVGLYFIIQELAFWDRLEVTVLVSWA